MERPKINTMDIASIIKAVLTSAEDQTGRTMSDLQPGDQLIGRVLKVQSDGRVLMDLGGRRALARIGFSVQSGQFLPLQVVENGSVLHLQIEQASTGGKTGVPLPNTDFQAVFSPAEREKLVGTVQRLIAQTETGSAKYRLPDGVNSALTRLISLFEPAPVSSNAKVLSQWVKSAVEDSGLFLEKKLGEVVTVSRDAQVAASDTESTGSVARAIITRDIKSQLLLLRQFLQPSAEQTVLMDKLDAKSAVFLRHAVDQLLGHITSQQDRAIPRATDGETPQVFVHTFQVEDKKNPLRLKVYYPRKKAQSKGTVPHRIALLLDLDRLGPLRVDLSMQSRVLQIRFYAAHQRALDLIQPEVVSVSDALTGYFEHVAIDCVVSREKIVGFEKEDVEGTGGGRIDLSV